MVPPDSKVVVPPLSWEVVVLSVPVTSVLPVLVYPPLAFSDSPAPNPTFPELVNRPVEVTESPVPFRLRVPALVKVPVTPRVPPTVERFRVITAPAALPIFPPTVAAPPVTVRAPPELLLKSPVEVTAWPEPKPMEPVLAIVAAVNVSPPPFMITLPALPKVWVTARAPALVAAFRVRVAPPALLKFPPTMAVVPVTVRVPPELLLKSPVEVRVWPEPTPMDPVLANEPAVNVSPVPFMITMPALLNVPVTARAPAVVAAFRLTVAPPALLRFPPTVTVVPVTVKEPPLLLKSPVEVRVSPEFTPMDPVLAIEPAVRLSLLPFMFSVPALVSVPPTDTVSAWLPGPKVSVPPELLLKAPATASV